MNDDLVHGAIAQICGALAKICITADAEGFYRGKLTEIVVPVNEPLGELIVSVRFEPKQRGPQIVM